MFQYYPSRILFYGKRSANDIYYNIINSEHIPFIHLNKNMISNMHHNNQKVLGSQLYNIRHNLSHNRLDEYIKKTQILRQIMVVS